MRPPLKREACHNREVSELNRDRAGGDQASEPTPTKGRFKRVLLPLAMRYSWPRQGLGIQVVYRNAPGGLIVGGLSYAALFALIPTIVLVVAGIFLIVDDPGFRADAVELINKALPAFEGVTDQAVDGAGDMAAVGGIIALIGFLWGASGLYLNLTRAMERFFPGERVSGALARVAGVLLVVVIIVGVLAAVFVAGVVTVIAQALELDIEWLLRVTSVAATLAIATGIVYGVYRAIPANPPIAHSARLPAVLVGMAIALMTLLYSVLSPWLVSSFQTFGAVASVFTALVWLRTVFLAMTYGAAMTRYRDMASAASILGEAEPDVAATEYLLAEESARARREQQAARTLAEWEAQQRTGSGTAVGTEAERAGGSDSPD
jgi:uncharacterized BrkB/YihY/UPF0761 family membrane protein